MTTLYYYSATGNNLAVARDLADELSEDEIRITSIAKCLDKDFIEDNSDRIGIIFPVYFRDIPKIVGEFAKRLILKEDAYVFAVCTYHKDSYNALFNLSEVLKQSNITLNSGFRINMPGTSVLVLDFTSTDEENELRFLEEKKKIKEISWNVQNRIKSGIEGTFNGDEKYESQNYMYNKYNVVKEFWVNENCNLCGICTKVCIRGIIKIVDGKVTWEGNCEYCQACLHWCPMKAIQNGENTEKCRRYHHPDININEIIND